MSQVAILDVFLKVTFVYLVSSLGVSAQTLGNMPLPEYLGSLLEDVYDFMHKDLLQEVEKCSALGHLPRVRVNYRIECKTCCDNTSNDFPQQGSTLESLDADSTLDANLKRKHAPCEPGETQYFEDAQPQELPQWLESSPEPASEWIHNFHRWNTQEPPEVHGIPVHMEDVSVFDLVPKKPVETIVLDSPEESDF